MTLDAGILEQELQAFEARKEEFLRHHEGQYVVLRGRDLLGAYTTERQAYEAALARVGNVPMLIRRVQREPEVPDNVPALQVGAVSERS